MNRDTIGGQWTQVKGKVKQQWAKLTDDDVTRIEGQREVRSARSRSATASRRTKPSGR